MNCGYVFCEGKQDEAVFRAMIDSLGLEGLHVHNYEGKNRLKNALAAFASGKDYTARKYGRVLVTRDSDDDATAAWQSLQDSMEHAFEVKPIAQGVAVAAENGVLLAGLAIPGDGSPGMIESICMSSLDPNSHPELKCVNGFIDCMETLQEQNIHPKTRFNVWVQSQLKKGYNLDKALKEARFDFEAESFKTLRDALRWLAG